MAAIAITTTPNKRLMVPEEEFLQSPHNLEHITVMGEPEW
jgi:hypothetical protein